MSSIRRELAIATDMSQLALYRKRRPNLARALGCVLLPATITDAWYAQECPARIDTTGISRTDRARWHLSRVLRGV